MEGANFLSGKSMRASCGLKEPAISERRREVLVLFLFSDVGAEVEGMKESSQREVRYWVRLEEMSESV
jgi:hypothetical protein